MHTDMARVHIPLATRDPRTLEDPIDQQTSGRNVKFHLDHIVSVFRESDTDA
jgi:hypothetical protein